ncbi:M14 family metallopeptidase [Methylonatrum kenyense]|uniref:M14 family metallopeptidase n=1 Tax=Methylonatrum kenyense TaxID=455253 RepID=UPI0020C154D2|nr:M14 family metallopeptidase [Methylonatrum kenyense]MCK8514786.1 M14 family metallopeptidase [Methylonatrum kenyense]
MPQTLPPGRFTETYLDYQALTAQLQQWADTYPDVVRLESLTRTPEGRDVWLLVVGPDPDRQRPGVWIDGNMHGAELAGSSVALAIAEAAIDLHHPPGPLDAALPAHLLDWLTDVLFYVCPRISPDGAEHVIRTGSCTRSAPRRAAHAQRDPYWEPADIDGTGWCRMLRIEDPAGDFVAAADRPGLMLPRTIDDPPPYYRLYPEGLIENWDGETLPQSSGLAGVTDFNRNFPWSWQPEPEQVGAGDFPGSEPETRAVIDYAVRHPNLYAWLNLHTFGGVFIRPRIDVPDTRMDQADLALYRQLEAWGEETIGYPTVSGFEQFTYEPEKPLHGDLVEFAYHQRGCLAEVCELWDLFRTLDRPLAKRFVENYSALGRDDMLRLASWDADHNGGRLFRDWRTAEHPQLGPVEVGGVNPLIGVWNPPLERLAGICERMSEYWLRVAAMLPRLELAEISIEMVTPQLNRITVRLRNRGYLATDGLSTTRESPWNEPIRASLQCDGCHLPPGEHAQRTLPSLDGWGRGQGVWSHMPWLQRSRGSGHEAVLRWLVRGTGSVQLQCGNPRLGWLVRQLTLPLQ